MSKMSSLLDKNLSLKSDMMMKKSSLELIKCSAYPLLSEKSY